MRTARIVFFTFFISFVVIPPAVLQIYDNILYATDDLDSDFTKIDINQFNQLHASELLHHNVIQILNGFGWINGLLFLSLGCYKKIRNKKGSKVNPTSSDQKAEVGIDKVADKVATVYILTVLLTSVILLAIIGAYIFWR